MSELDRLSVEALERLFSPEVVALNVEGLARALGVHRLTVSRRLDRLYEEGVLLPPQPRLEWGKLGRELVTLTLTKVKKREAKKSRKSAERSPQILAYGDASSERDINWFELAAHRGLDHYLMSPQREGARLNPHHTIVAHIPTSRMRHWPLPYLIENAPALEERDELTRELVLEIFNNDHVRVNENEIARQLGVHRQTVKRRVDAMKESGLIRRISPEVGWDALGLPLSVITLIDFDASKREEIVEFAASSRRVRWSGPCTSESTLNTFLLSLHPDLQSYVDWRRKIRERYEKNFGGASIHAFVPTSTVEWNDPRLLLKAGREQ